jgi:hypothetical protein
MKTATETMIEQREKQISELRLNAMIEAFIEAYQPRDHRGAQFAMRLIEIVRLTHQTACEPYIKEWSILMGANLMKPIIV